VCEIGQLSLGKEKAVKEELQVIKRVCNGSMGQLFTVCTHLKDSWLIPLVVILHVLPLFARAHMSSYFQD
jgi:hypothetical protein